MTANPFDKIIKDAKEAESIKDKIQFLTRALDLMERVLALEHFWSRIILAFPFFWVTLRRIPKWGEWRVLSKKDGSYRAGYLTLGWIQFGFLLRPRRAP